MMRRLYGAGLLAVLLAPFALPSTAQAFVFWSNKDGTASFFDWKNGGSDNGFFGSPVLVNGDTFVFFPQNFRAESFNGVPGSKADRLEVELIAHTNSVFRSIQITELGDYGILTQGQVSVTGGLFATDLDRFRVRSDSLVSTPGSPITSGQGNWTATAGVDFSADFPEWTHFRMVLDNNLLAISQPGSQSFIQKKVLGAGVAVTIIPEPAGLLLLAFGGLFLRRR